jgi:Methylase involved in ubiquinone/menaquinone biosynthesis
MDLAYFNEIASKYDSWYQTPMGKFVDGVETRLAFELFVPEKGMKVLDAGCGTGNFSMKLAGRGAQVTGIDLSTEMMAVAQEKARRRALDIQFMEMNIYSLDFPDNYFDGVFSMAVFETLVESEKAFRELMRVLKPGKFLMIGTIRKDSAWGRSYEKRIKEDPNTIYRYSVFKSLQEFEEVDREHLIRTGQCLFIPPGVPEEQYNEAEEERLAKTEAGGFMAGLWRKPA